MFRANGAGVSHPGKVREVNEDSFLENPGQGLWAVADGMGGHEKGHWASAQVTEALAAVELSGDIGHDCELIADALAEANARIYSSGSEGGNTIGSTAVVLRISGGRFACLWAGDSRLYVVRKGTARQLSRDHSQVEELVAAGVMTRAAARDHPLGNVITRAIGVEEDLALDVIEGEVADQDRFLLCSDGLTCCVPDEEIGAMAFRGTPRAACDLLVEKCMERGAPDNVSVVIVACELTTATWVPEKAQVAQP